VIGHSPAAKVTAGVRFPLLVFAVWRVLHGIVVLALGGSLREMTFAWDGGWYLSILHSGYVVPAGGYGQESNAAFFPGLPWVTQVVQFVVRQETGATLLVANALALAAFVTVWGAVRAWVDEAMARRATVALALFPTSYFLWMYYTEALFIAGTAAAVWAGRRKRHNLATALSSSLRPPGSSAPPSARPSPWPGSCGCAAWTRYASGTSSGHSWVSAPSWPGRPSRSVIRSAG